MTTERRSVRFTMVTAMTALTALAGSTASGASLIPLGHLPGTNVSYAHGVSDDGSVVVGVSLSFSVTAEAFRWTSAGGMVALGVEDGYQSEANGISGDGSVIVGRRQRSSDGANSEAVRWSSAVGIQGLGYGGPGGGASEARGVNGDGSVIVGGAGGPARWTGAGVWTHLGDLPGGTTEGFAYAVSGDGSVIVGYSYADTGSRAFRWTSGEGMVDLGVIPGDVQSYANAINGDGSVIVGTSFSNSGGRGFRWTSGGGMVDLGTFAPTAVSDDGSVVVGNSGQELFRWTAGTGMERLWDVLLANGVDPAADGWTKLSVARGLSAEGNTIVGWGQRNGNTEAFVAVVPEPSSALLLMAAVAGVAMRRVRRTD